jgi:hypothetical protein
LDFGRIAAHSKLGEHMSNPPLKLGKYSVGTGDRFAHQAKAQLQACVQALALGIEVIPVWNKSNREHSIIGSEPASARQAADAAVKALGWTRPYFLDADHITLETVDRFLNSCDFYTIDVADFIGQPAQEADIDSFVKRHPELLGSLHLAGTDEALEISANDLRESAHKFLAAIKKAGEVTAVLSTPKVQATSSPKSRWTKPTAPRAPLNCLLFWQPSRMKASTFRPLPPSSAAGLTRALIMWAT